ncbi:MAG: hypothetical protein R3F20_13165 [Planctomycetota bacterium]
MTALLDRFGAWLVDRLNPIVVKEIRQGMKGRLFHAWFLIVLCIGSIVTLVSSHLIDELDDVSFGRDVFLWFVFFSNFLALALAPMTAYLTISAERDDRTLELVDITRLRPSDVVRGKIFSTLTQALLYISALVPFMVFCYFLRGLDIPSILLVLAIQVLSSALFTTIAIAVATSIASRPVRLIVGALLALGFLTTCFLGLGAAFEIIREGVAAEIIRTLGETETRQVLAGILFVYTSTLALAYAVAVGNTSFESANRATPVRIVLFAQWLGFLALMTWVHLDGSHSPGTLVTFVLLFFALWFVAGFWLVSDPGRISRRTWRHLESRARETRFLLSAFLPGAERGVVFFLLPLIATPLLALGLRAWVPPDPARVSFGRFATGELFPVFLGLGAAYAAVYVLGPWLVCRLLRIHAAAKVRVAIVLGLLLGLTLPLLTLLAAEPQSLDFDLRLLVWGSNPVYALASMAEEDRIAWTLVRIALPTAGVLVVAAIAVAARRLLPRGPEEPRG